MALSRGKDNQTIHDPDRFEALVHLRFVFLQNTQSFGILFRSGLFRLASIGFAITTINTNASVAEDHL